MCNSRSINILGNSLIISLLGIGLWITMQPQKQFIGVADIGSKVLEKIWEIKNEVNKMTL